MYTNILKSHLPPAEKCIKGIKWLLKVKSENIKLLLTKVLHCIKLALSYGVDRIRVLSTESIQCDWNIWDAAVVLEIGVGGGDPRLSVMKSTDATFKSRGSWFYACCITGITRSAWLPYSIASFFSARILNAVHAHEHPTHKLRLT